MCEEKEIDECLSSRSMRSRMKATHSYKPFPWVADSRSARAKVLVLILIRGSYQEITLEECSLPTSRDDEGVGMVVLMNENHNHQAGIFWNHRRPSSFYLKLCRYLWVLWIKQRCHQIWQCDWYGILEIRIQLPHNFSNRPPIRQLRWFPRLWFWHFAFSTGINCSTWSRNPTGLREAFLYIFGCAQDNSNFRCWLERCPNVVTIFLCACCFLFISAFQ